MFVHWKASPLAERPYVDGVCFHGGVDRKTYTPYVKESFRDVHGVPRHRVLLRLDAIRSCCIEDLDDPVARVDWWNALNFKLNFLVDLPDDAEVTGRLIKGRDFLRQEFARRIAEPRDEEYRLVNCLRDQDASRRYGESLQDHRQRCLQEARDCLGARRAQWEKGEQAFWWNKGTHRQVAMENRRRANQPPSFCRVLGLRLPFTHDDARKAWRRAVKRAHPDQGGSAERFRAVQGALAEAVEYLRSRGVAA